MDKTERPRGPDLTTVSPSDATDGAPAAPRGGAPDAASTPSAKEPLRRRIDRFAFGPRPPEDLPESVLAAARRAERSAEVLLTLAQILALAFFGLVYAATPKAFPPDAPFEPVPALLALYAGFTALRLWLALRDRLPTSMQYASIALDMGVLMATIWSFHLQYGVAPSVYLKAPTLLYVFILIALRTMRGDAGQVLFAGACAILGYAALAEYALAEGGMEIVTHDWAEYMTSAKILVGGEVDKLLSIGAVTGILALAVTRARRMLLVASAERHAAAELSRFFPPQIANAIRAADIAREAPGARREAAVMMIDLRGFSAIAAELSPREVLAILSEYQSRVVPIIHRHGGAVDKYLGDGVLATFGATAADPRFAETAVAAFAEALRAGAEWEASRRYEGQPAPRVAAALDIGRLTLGVVGADDRLEFTIIGDVVNRVAKLEKHARALGARGVVTRRALDRAGGEAALAGLSHQAAPREAVPGLAAPLDLVAVSPGG